MLRNMKSSQHRLPLSRQSETLQGDAYIKVRKKHLSGESIHTIVIMLNIQRCEQIKLM